MSQKSLEVFLEKVGSDDELRGSIESQLDNDGNISVDALIVLGADYGCEFTLEDLEGAVELSDGELDGVAGGSAYSRENHQKTFRFVDLKHATHVSYTHTDCNGIGATSTPKDSNDARTNFFFGQRKN